MHEGEDAESIPLEKYRESGVRMLRLKQWRTARRLSGKIQIKVLTISGQLSNEDS